MFTDKYGIKQLNDSVGLEWWSNWNDGDVTRIYSHGRTVRDEDPDDPTHMSYLHCHSYDEEDNWARIDGNGLLTLMGDHPRFYINKPDLTPSWLNVEMTCYAKFIDATNDAPYVTFRLATRSNHHAEHLCLCNGLGYGLEWRLNKQNRLSFRKELIHSHSAWVIGPNPPSNSSYSSDWRGLKFIVRNCNNNTNVKLECYVDTTNGANGGQWVKLFDYIDNGNMAITDPPEFKNLESDIATCTSNCLDPKPVKPYNKIILRKGVSSYLRTDYVENIKFKKFSVREIAPLP